MSDTDPRPGPLWFRENDGLEFDRHSFFNDAVFAIAMTLLIVTIAVPAIRDTTSSHDLARALRTMLPQFVAFFIGFAVLGNYWMANNRFTSHLRGIEPAYVGIGLVYLAFVAWLPFPTALLGEYSRNPVAVALFALSAGMVSLLEAMLLRRADRVGLLRQELPRPVYRYALTASLLPVVVFVFSVPIAFLNTYVGIATWALALPAQVVLDRNKPEAFDSYFH